MIGVILPILLIVGSVLYILQVIVFGVLAFCLNFVIFYYCLGPHNVFYGESEQASDYFAIANNQLFAVIFWYIVLGPIAILLYRLIDLCQQQDLVKNSSKCILDLLDWIPARITTLFYLLAGNFQNGFSFWLKMITASPNENAILLNRVGALASSQTDDPEIALPAAQHLIEYTVIIYLLFLAMLTLVSWL